MANALYQEAGRKALEEGLGWSTNNFKCILVSKASYTVNLATHKFLSDVPTSARVGSAVSMTGRTSDNGAADANDCTFDAVSGDQVGAIIIYQDTGQDSTATLIAYIDQATGLPITPNGGAIIVTWDNGQYKIFAFA